MIPVRRRGVRPWGLLLFGGLLVLGGTAEARRKAGKGKRPRRPPEAETERPEVRAAPTPCPPGQPPCEGRLLLRVLDRDGPGEKATAAGSYRYRLRFGEEELVGACPGEGRPATGTVQCTPEGLSLRLTPRQVDVYLEAFDRRPVLQAVAPAYTAAPGCGGPCQQGEVVLELRAAGDTRR